jgi:hypothetical protein
MKECSRFITKIYIKVFVPLLLLSDLYYMNKSYKKVKSFYYEIRDIDILNTDTVEI